LRASQRIPFSIFFYIFDVLIAQVRLGNASISTRNMGSFWMEQLFQRMDTALGQFMDSFRFDCFPYPRTWNAKVLNSIVPFGELTV
jgi:hypothetical protein